MAEFCNLTPFAATTLPSMSFDDRQLMVAVVAGRFHMPLPRSHHREPTISEFQPPVPLADEWRGPPGASSLRLEGQSTHVRPGTDIYLEGHAWAPGGQPCEESMVAIAVGPCRRGALVFGDRTWTSGILGARPSRPRPFTTIPLTYERCFGGPTSEHNPVGCGLYERQRDAIGQPLPNLEDPPAQITTLSDRPRPAGFGPIARHWRPRRDHGGTYDEHWRRNRAPLWPKNADARLFNAAPSDLVAQPRLAGGESVQLLGVHPDGPIGFALPRITLKAKFTLRRGESWQHMQLDALRLEPDAGSFTLYWRAAVAVSSDLFELERIVVRPVREWEACA
jgi:hypothetical protein